MSKIIKKSTTIALITAVSLGVGSIPILSAPASAQIHIQSPAPSRSAKVGPSTKLKLNVVSSNKIKLSWNTYKSPSKGWLIGRDNYDSKGNPQWSGKFSGSKRVFIFNNLKPNKTYNFYVKNLDTGVVMKGSGVIVPKLPAKPQTPISTNRKSEYGKLSGLPWDSGVFPMHKASVVKNFESARGRKVDVITIFPERTNWEKMKEGWVIDSDRIPSDYRGTLDVGVPLWPDDGNVEDAASGKYNAHWEQFARMISAKYPNAYIRLGWEMNLPGWKAHATPQNAEKWKKAYRQAVISLRKGGKNLRIAWVVNEGPGQTGTRDARLFYPGNGYVDYIGMDAYDWWPAYNNPANIAKHRDSEYGWNFWLNFAKQNNKKFVLPEWGVAPANSASGGDNPQYIKFVYNWMKTNKTWIAYESYFNESDYYIKSDLFTNNPKSSNEYKKLVLDLSSMNR